MEYFRKQNIEFYNFLDETFKINSSKNWGDISKNITKDRIKATYKFFSKLFPRNLEYTELLKSVNRNFKTIHYGNLNGRSILNEVIRFSLYSDEIIVFHPLQNPSVTNQKINPIKNPKYWLPDFMTALYFYIVIQKWVKAGIIQLIINPTEYNFELREKIDKKVEKRKNEYDVEHFFNLEKDNLLVDMAEPFALIYGNKGVEFIKDKLLNIENPRFNEEDADEFAKVIRDFYPKINPLYQKLGIPRNTASIVTNKSGGPLESIALISQLTNSNIYTTGKSKWHQIQQFGYDDLWTKINNLYSKIPLNFLDNVDTGFALSLREKERLTGVRKGIRELFASLNSISVNNLREDQIFDLHETFIEEIRKAEAEWSLIKKEAKNQRYYWAGASVGIPIVANEMSILPLIAGSVLWLGKNLYSERLRLDTHRIINPMSVFVDLKNKEKGFFSELKNCIF